MTRPVCTPGLYTQRPDVEKAREDGTGHLLHEQAPRPIRAPDDAEPMRPALDELDANLRAWYDHERRSLAACPPTATAPPPDSASAARRAGIESALRRFASRAGGRRATGGGRQPGGVSPNGLDTHTTRHRSQISPK
jgi:hypothetical protein